MNTNEAIEIAKEIRSRYAESDVRLKEAMAVDTLIQIAKSEAERDRLENDLEAKAREFYRRTRTSEQSLEIPNARQWVDFAREQLRSLIEEVEDRCYGGRDSLGRFPFFRHLLREVAKEQGIEI